jgi:hypothetical protein
LGYYSSACESGSSSIEPWIGKVLAFISCSLLFLLSCLSTPIKFFYTYGVFFNTCNIERNRTADFGVDAAEQAWLDDGASKTMFYLVN